MNGHGMATECPRNDHRDGPGRGRPRGGAVAAQVQDQTRASPVCTWEDGTCGCDPEFQDCGCTSIQVAKLASTDGSVMTAHRCDSNYPTWLQIEPERKNPAGAMRPIYW